MMQFIRNFSKILPLRPKPSKDYYLIKNIFTKTELNDLKQQMRVLENNPEALKKRAENKKGGQNKLVMIHEKTQLRRRLEKKIEEFLPFKKDSYEFFSMNFYSLKVPYALHCDNLGEEIGHYQIVIPLEYSPSQHPPYTIIFDQTSPTHTEWIAPAYNKASDYKPFHNKPIYDGSYYPLWTDEYKITEDEGVKYWGQTWWNDMYREAYKGFSIKYAYQWRVGDAFIFDSQYNHCASMLDAPGFAESKKGILVCLQQPQKD